MNQPTNTPIRDFGYFTVQQPRSINFKVAGTIVGGLLTLGFVTDLLTAM